MEMHIRLSGRFGIPFLHIRFLYQVISSERFYSELILLFTYVTNDPVINGKK